jgi:outer membrane lipoprotein-sorting protein
MRFKKGVMLSPRTFLTTLIFLLASLAPSGLLAWNLSDTENLLKMMETAYAKVTDYQADVEVRTYRPDGSFKTKKFLYTFKKPKRIRLDFQSPYSGMTLVYPDKNGNVILRYFFTIDLSPDNRLLQSSSGQRIYQTDLGLLIRNISHSLTDQRKGPLKITENDRDIRVRVLAEDHFRKGVVTLYYFVIDRKLWLPVQVSESTPQGVLERTVVFRDLRLNIILPAHFFEPGFTP